MYRFSNRIKEMGTSIFSTMTALANKYKAINLGQGFPESDGPQWIMEQAYKAMLDGKNQYAPMNGIYSLRKIICEIYEKHYNIFWNPETEITITSGATEALFSSINAILNPGDEAIMFEPFYDSYLGDILIAGGVPKFVTLHKPDFSFDIKELKSIITRKTKLIILNNPNNPSGKVFIREELNTIAEVAIINDLYIISDEVYEFLTYDSVQHIPIATLPEMKERVITISSTGKTFSMTGWKIGWAIASSEITNAIQKVHQWTTFTINSPGQHAMAYAFTQLEDYLPKFKKEYQVKRDFTYSQLLGSPFYPYKPYGSYFLLTEKPKGCNLNDFELAEMLVKNYGVATIPSSFFYSLSNEGLSLLRICFAKNNDSLREGINRMKSFKA
jgi:aspartate/methionine/tyrosine aminotransferase